MEKFHYYTSAKDLASPWYGTNCSVKSAFTNLIFIGFVSLLSEFSGKCPDGISGIQLLSCKVCWSLAPLGFYLAIQHSTDFWGDRTHISLVGFVLLIVD